jgi:hypothetical protein
MSEPAPHRRGGRLSGRLPFCRFPDSTGISSTTVISGICSQCLQSLAKWLIGCYTVVETPFFQTFRRVADGRQWRLRNRRLLVRIQSGVLILSRPRTSRARSKSAFFAGFAATLRGRPFSCPVPMRSACASFSSATGRVPEKSTNARRLKRPKLVSREGGERVHRAPGAAFLVALWRRQILSNQQRGNRRPGSLISSTTPPVVRRATRGSYTGAGRSLDTEASINGTLPLWFK